MKFHIVEKGESLWLIAQMHNLTLSELIEANPQISDPNYILIGEKIFIPNKPVIPLPPEGSNRPVYPGENEPVIPLPPEDSNRPVYPGVGEDDTELDEVCKKLAALPRPLIYVVRSGDTLYKIGKCFDLSLKELIMVNPQISNPDIIYPGEKIFIPRSRKNMLTDKGTEDLMRGRSYCPNCGSVIK